MIYVTGLGWVSHDGRALAPHSAAMIAFSREVSAEGRTATPAARQLVGALAAELEELQCQLDETLEAGGELLAATQNLQRQFDQAVYERDQARAMLALANERINEMQGAK